MTTTKLVAIPAIALAAGLSLAACGSQAAAPHAIAKPKPVVTVTVTAKPAPVKTAHHAPKPVVTAPAPAPTQAAALPTVLTNSGISTTDKAVEPSTISTSADGTGIISGITWSSWTAYSAEGSGSISLDNGVPNMAQGIIVNVPVSVALSAPTNGGFTAMTVTDHAGNSNVYNLASDGGGGATDGLNADDPATPAPVSTPTPNNDQNGSNNPPPGAPSCTTVNGNFSGGLPGHVAPSGECLPDGANGNA
jgi:hypothetical protein